jgi:hypothetical protein
MNNVSSSYLARRCQLCLVPAFCVMLLALGVFSSPSTAHAAVTLQSGQSIHLAGAFPSAWWSLQMRQDATTTYANALTTGTVTFSNRNVEIHGVLDSSSPQDCVSVELKVVAGSRTMSSADVPTSNCVSNTGSIFNGLTLPANVPGGASYLLVTLHDTNINQVKSVRCFRDSTCANEP